VEASELENSPMPSSLQYPLERSQALQEKWLRMVQEPPPRDEDDEDDEDQECAAVTRVSSVQRQRKHGFPIWISCP
jgi:hypothetical protein